MKVKSESFIIFCALFLSFGLSLSMFLTFLWAFFHGYRAWVTVNDYGEAYPELVMFLVLMPLIVYGLVLSYKKIKKEVVR